jgi:hypothetical protein
VINRETIYTALLAKLASTGQFVTVGRKPIPPSELTAEMQPALFMEEVRETANPRPRGLPLKWTLEVDLGIYHYCESQPVTAGQDDATPATALNQLIAAVECALAPDANGVQTLGGLVDHCWIEGEVIKAPAYLQAQGAAVVPVKILAV